MEEKKHIPVREESISDKKERYHNLYEHYSNQEHLNPGQQHGTGNERISGKLNRLINKIMRLFKADGSLSPNDFVCMLCRMR